MNGFFQSPACNFIQNDWAELAKFSGYDKYVSDWNNCRPMDYFETLLLNDDRYRIDWIMDAFLSGEHKRPENWESRFLMAKE